MTPAAALRTRRPRRSSRGRPVDVVTAALAVFVTAGIALRLGYWWQNRPFWRDELALVQSLDTYGFRELLGPLSDAQAAPPMWLWAERAVTSALGMGERAYRLLPLLAGAAAVGLLAVLAVRIVTHRWAALVAVGLGATVAQVVFYSAQTKQYTTDLALVTALLLLAHVLVRGQPRPRIDLAWYVCLTVFPWFSHGAMLTVPAVAAWVLAVRLRQRQTGLVRGVAALIVPALSTLGAALHAQSLTGRVDAFANYWADYLGPGSASPGAWVDWHAFVFRDLAERTLGAPVWWAALILIAAGFVVAWRRDPVSAVLLLLPIAVTYVAAAAGMFPMGRRLVLFVLPSVLCALAALVDGVVRGAMTAYDRARFRARYRWLYRGPAARLGFGRWRAASVGTVAGVAAVGVIAATCWTTPNRLIDELRFQFGTDDYRTALTWVADHWEPGDLLIVGNGDRAAARVYGPRLGIPADAMLRAMPARDVRERTDCPLPGIVADAPRAWLVTGDLVDLYAGITSRYGIVAPMTGRFHVIYQHVRGQVTVQLVEAERPPKPQNAQSARCLDYAPVGEAGDLPFPPALR